MARDRVNKGIGHFVGEIEEDVLLGTLLARKGRKGRGEVLVSDLGEVQLGDMASLGPLEVGKGC